jgi:hypothetical protein
MHVATEIPGRLGTALRAPQLAVLLALSASVTVPLGNFGGVSGPEATTLTS